MDPWLFHNNTVFPSAPVYYGTLPLDAQSNVAGDGYMPPGTIGTRVPFVMYALGAVSCFLFISFGIATLALQNPANPIIVWLKISPIPASVILLLNLFSFVVFLVAVTLLNRAGDSLEYILYDAKTETANSVNLGHAFLATSWTLVAAEFIATILVWVRWRLIRRTPRRAQRAMEAAAAAGQAERS
jgi:hypothetical protein